MGVRKGREVEPGGRVKEEVVEGWWQGWEVCSLLFNDSGWEAESEMPRPKLPAGCKGHNAASASGTGAVWGPNMLMTRADMI